jgi:hypothetical protein
MVAVKICAEQSTERVERETLAVAALNHAGEQIRRRDRS